MGDEAEVCSGEGSGQRFVLGNCGVVEREWVNLVLPRPATELQTWRTHEPCPPCLIETSHPLAPGTPSSKVDGNANMF
jgi:hypothetical protein